MNGQRIQHPHAEIPSKRHCQAPKKCADQVSKRGTPSRAYHGKVHGQPSP